MSDMIRCPACRGSKKVAKLGGIIGDCNMCDGDGRIATKEKAKPVVAVVDAEASELIKAVSEAIAAPIPEPVKVDAKRAIYKRKKA